MHFDLVVLGNLIVDDIVYESGETLLAQPGGAILYMGLTAHLWNLEIGLVSIAGQDFPATLLAALEERGVDLSGVRRSNQPGLRTWLLYEGSRRRVVHRLDGATHAQSSPTVKDLPDGWRAPAIHLAPMPFDHQDELAAELSSRYGDDIFLSLDPFEPLTEESLVDWHNLLSRIDLFFVSEDEMAARQDRLDPESFLRQLITGRLGTLLYKQGGRGGVALRPAGSAALPWPGRATSVVDTTGAGDAFACGVLAGLLRDRPLAQALEWGIVSASFAIQGKGVEGLLQATPAAAQERLESWFGP
jgi:sugar/nucleoside kinase (ribokinase family)